MNTLRGWSAQTSSAAALNTAMSKVYGYMGLGLFLTAAVAYLTLNTALFAIIMGTSLKWVALLAPLGFVLAMAFGYEKFSANTLRTLFISYSAINGLSLSVIGAVYTLGSLAGVFLLTAGLFSVMSVYGYFTKKDLTSWGQLLFWALIGIIAAMIINIFIGSSVMTTVISMVAVIVFLGLTAYDTQKIREMLWAGDDTGKGTIMGALTLYLDFLNLFLHLLQLLGVKKN